MSQQLWNFGKLFNFHSFDVLALKTGLLIPYDHITVPCHTPQGLFHGQDKLEPPKSKENTIQ